VIALALHESHRSYYGSLQQYVEEAKQGWLSEGTTQENWLPIYQPFG
jgi:hypothetical protein